jgi:hypothetical protein
MSKKPAKYLVTNKSNGTLYTGVSGDLPKRVWQRKKELAKYLKGTEVHENYSRVTPTPFLLSWLWVAPSNCGLR